MKKFALFLCLTALMLSPTSCGPSGNQDTPEGYVRYCVRYLGAAALYADTPEWKETKKEILAEARRIETMDEARQAVRKAARVAGGKHSTLIAPVKDTTSYEEAAPETRMLEGGIAYLRIPAHTGVKVPDSLYTHSALDFLQGNRDAKGVVIDLRDNSGGNMYPMIAAVSPLLPDGGVISFKTRRRTSSVSLESIVRRAGLSRSQTEKFPSSTRVAILTNNWTGSSGEATLLCFRGLDNVRTFGSPTAGFASANIPVELADGYKLLITVGCDVARTGEIFCDDPIEPEVNTATPLEDAVRWIQSLE